MSKQDVIIIMLTSIHVLMLDIPRIKKRLKSVEDFLQRKYRYKSEEL